mmetsp:Transcript_14352/g.39229  ORF Transcript_14352/g.39229 Transcript_14352/m.39229 type:complete len:84 (+) Transcript_14352:218-469(+)
MRTAQDRPRSTTPHDGSTRYRSRAVVRILKACLPDVLLTKCRISSAITYGPPEGAAHSAAKSGDSSKRDKNCSVYVCEKYICI